MGRLRYFKSLFRSILKHQVVRWAPGVIALFGLAAMLIWSVPQWRAPSFTTDAAGQVVPVDEVTRAQLEDDLRRTWAQITGGLVLLLGVIAAFWRASATERNLGVLQEGQITERFTRAVEQLGSDNTAVCLGGIYALERIANDSPKDHWQAMEVLTAYVRDKARWLKPTEPTDEADETDGIEHRPSITIQAILTVIGRRDIGGEGLEQKLDLQRTDLRGADLGNAKLDRALLNGVRLEQTSLRGAHLNGAFLNYAYLVGASLYGAHLGGASLYDAHLEGASLFAAHLEEASLNDAHLEGAFLFGATGLVPDQLIDAYWDEVTIFPEGFQPPRMRED